MSKGTTQYHVLKNSLGRDYLIEQGKNQGINWSEDSHPGKNWMRFSQALIGHLNDGKQFDTDSVDPQVLQSMKDQYVTLRDMHKQTMIPHVRAALQKLHEQSGDQTKTLNDYLPHVYSHLDANGGHIWAEKVRTLNTLNSQIKSVSNRLASRMM